MEALTDNGVKEKDVQTSQFSIKADEEIEQTNRAGNPGRPPGNQLSDCQDQID